jgi:hypothetical protein
MNINKNSEVKSKLLFISVWKQTYNNDKRQVESFAKDITKLFAFSTTITPWN